MQYIKQILSVKHITKEQISLVKSIKDGHHFIVKKCDFIQINYKTFSKKRLFNKNVILNKLCTILKQISCKVFIHYFYFFSTLFIIFSRDKTLNRSKRWPKNKNYFHIMTEHQTCFKMVYKTVENFIEWSFLLKASILYLNKVILVYNKVIFILYTIGKHAYSHRTFF